MTRHMRRKIIILWSFAFCFLLVAEFTEAGDRPGYKRTVEYYTIPDVTLVNQDGEKVVLKDLLDSDKPVIVDFVYATCTTICPILSAGFSHLQKKLGPDVEQVRLVSITIDPDNDRPDTLRQYLDRYNAGPGWDFLTGNRNDIIKVMRAFDAYVENKMSHYPLTILHVPGSKEWIRIYGLVGTSELMGEYGRLVQK